MDTTCQLDAPVAHQAMALSQAVQTRGERRFCPSMFCFTDEISVRQLSLQANVWLLTDERDEQPWLMMGNEPVCPHCGTLLL